MSALLLSLLLLACSSEPSAHELAEARLEAATAQALAPPGPAPEATADLGAQTYATYCSSCHGPQGRGDGPAAAALEPPPTDLTGPRPADKRGQPGGRRVVIEQGGPGTSMVGYAEVLTTAQLDAVVGFVHELRHGPGSAADCASGEPCGGGMGRGLGQGRGMGMGAGGGQ